MARYNDNPYPDYGDAIAHLVDLEGLHYEPNHMGRKIDYTPEEDGLSM